MTNDSPGGVDNGSRQSAPELTLAVPVYNGDRTLKRALDAIRSQTYTNFVVLVGDNGSSDRTHEICAEVAAGDPRIKVRRLPSTVSALENFARLLEEATTPYFMFAAADDYLLPEFVERNLEKLKANASAVCSVSKAEFLLGDRQQALSNGTFSLTGTRRERLRKYLKRPTDNSRFYGIYRTSTLKRSFSRTPIAAADWLISASTLMYGDHLEVEDILFRRERTPYQKYRDLTSQTEKSFLGRCFPVLTMITALSHRLGVWETLLLLPNFALLLWRSTSNSPYRAVRFIRSLIWPRWLSALVGLANNHARGGTCSAQVV